MGKVNLTFTSSDICFCAWMLCRDMWLKTSQTFAFLVTLSTFDTFAFHLYCETCTKVKEYPETRRATKVVPVVKRTYFALLCYAKSKLIEKPTNYG